MAIDFKVYQLQHIANQEYYQIPGFLIRSAPKGAHRHRQSDIFAIQLIREGDELISGEDLQETISRACDSFFHAQGSVTHAIQTVVEGFNKQFYALNAEWGYDGRQISGSINISVYHHDWLFIGQINEAYTYLIGDEKYELFGESESNSDKLGISRRISTRFYQTALNPGDMLLMSPKAHGSWKAYYLSNSHQIQIPQLKRRLHNQMIQDFSVIVIKTESGNGVVQLCEWEHEAPPTPDARVADASNSQPIQSIEESEPDEKPEFSRTDSMGEEDYSEPAWMAGKEETSEIDHPSSLDSLKIKEGKTEEEDFSNPERPSQDDNPDAGGRKIIRAIARAWMQAKTVRAKLQLQIRHMTRKIFPKKISTPGGKHAWQHLLTVLIPLILVGGSLYIYSSSGKDEQYDQFMRSALEKSTSADIAETSAEKKEIWQAVMDFTLRAENYKVTNESRQLFLKAQATIDRMDLTMRLDFRPAMTQPFPESANITKIKDSSSGIYLLDSSTGNVLRVYLNPKGFFELDEEFLCTPKDYGVVKMGEVVDFVVLPANKKGYKVLAVDESGNHIYCQPGKAPDSRTLTEPEGGWGAVSQIAYYEERLFVMDASKNQIWVYESDNDENNELSGIVFVASPSASVDEDAPDIGGAIDIVINQGDLYILHEDGHMTYCQYDFENARLSDCEDPIPYTDNRTSSENNKPWIFTGTRFISMHHGMLPNPSIFLLDEVSSTLFQFSMQLNLENTLKPQVNPDFPLPGSSPTGFGILLDQEVLLAYGNTLFTAPLQ